MSDNKSDPQIAYEAYGDFVEWKNYIGVPMPQWDSVGDKIQEAWAAAVAAVLNKEDDQKDVAAEHGS